MAKKRLLVTDVLRLSPEEVAALPDAVIKELGYGIKYFDWTAAGIVPTPQEEANLRMLKERLWELERREEEELKRKLAQLPRPRMVLCDCGHYVPEGLVMGASFGTSCPDCYDRMEDYPPQRKEANDA